MSERGQRAARPAQSGSEIGTGENGNERERERARTRASRRGDGLVRTTGALAALLVVVAAVGLLAGLSLAGVVQQQTVSQEGAYYGASSSAVRSFPNAPTLALASVPGDSDFPGACTQAPVAFPAPSTTNYHAFAFLPVNGL